MVLATGGASFEVRPHAGHGGSCVGVGDFELDVAVELREALLASELRLGRSEKPGEPTR